MPLYEYRCEKCGHRFEVLQRLGEGAGGLACPACGWEEVAKLHSTFAAASAGGSADVGAGCGGGGCGAGSGFT